MPRFGQALAFLLFQIGRAAERLARLTMYMSAGTRDLADMQKDNQQVWDAFYDNHPAHGSGLMSWEQDYADRFVPPGAEVLLIGCGSGRDLLPLVRRGCHVTGIDPSNTALTIAERTLRAEGLSATLINGFFEDTPISQIFDAVIFSYYSYSLMPVARRRIAALAKAAALLKSGGHVLVSHQKPTSRPHALLVTLGRMTGAVTRSNWRIEPGDLVWDNRGARPSFSYTHVFEGRELEREATAACLRVVCRRVTDDGVALVLTRT
jgi:SAM-dependent methyltransferase